MLTHMQKKVNAIDGHKILDLSWIVEFKSPSKVVELMHKVNIGSNKDYNV